jgi:hypothetical protein
MPYNQPNTFQTQATNPNNISNPKVMVNYNGSGLHKIAGPVPFVSLSKNFVRTNVGELENITTSININGKIVRYDPTIEPGPSGISGITDAVKQMQDLFTKCPISTFDITCNNDKIFEASGVRVKSFNVDKSNDNWYFTADYTVELEYNEPLVAGAPLVTNMSDTWSIEPLEDYVYSNFIANSDRKGEYHNPKLSPTAPSENSPNPGGNVNGGDIANNSDLLRVVNIPQFKINHKLSAVGLPHQTGEICESGIGNKAYLEARRWVEQRAGVAFNYNAYQNNTSGLMHTPHITDNLNITSFDKTYLYNHLRTTNFSITEGSYEINDTWLAMPTGIKYIEDYTIETSTDDKFIKTIKVQGNIKGLTLVPFEVMTAQKGSGLLPDASGKIDLSYSQKPGGGSLPNSNGLLDVSGVSPNGPNDNFIANKYENALDAWTYDIKPYLYRRASMGINTSTSSVVTERRQDYINPAIQQNGSTQAPKNPIYCRENLLNIIPISTTEGHDPRKGTITYSYEYNNRLRLISGVISESISINDNGPTDVISETVVIGRRLGPVIQSLATKTDNKRDIAIEVTVVPPSSIAGMLQNNSQCPLYTGGTVYSTIDKIIEGFKPFGDRAGAVFGSLSRQNMTGQVYTASDNQSWNPAEGRYTRSVSWVFQQCSNNGQNSQLDT